MDDQTKKECPRAACRCGKHYNAETRRALKDSEDDANVEYFSSAEELLDDLGISTHADEMAEGEVEEYKDLLGIGDEIPDPPVEP